MRRRNSIIVEETGTCNKLDVACAERVSQVISRCSKKHSVELREATRECSDSADPDTCEEKARERFQESILDCIEGD